jgi:WD40 repeat protein
MHNKTIGSEKDMISRIQPHITLFLRGEKHSNRIGYLDFHKNPEAPKPARMQVSSVSGNAFAAVWRVDSCKLLAELLHPPDSRGVFVCAFSGDGKLLATVTGDNRNTVRVYEWSSQRLVASGPGYQGVPPQVFGAEFDTFEGSGQLRCVRVALLKLCQ